MVDAQRKAAARPAAPAQATLPLNLVFNVEAWSRRAPGAPGVQADAALAFDADAVRNAYLGSGELPALEEILGRDRADAQTHRVVRDLIALGVFQMHRGNYADAGRRFDAAVAAADRLDAPEWRGAALVDRGVVLALRGRYAESITSTREAMAAFRRVAEEQVTMPRPSPADAAAVAQALRQQMAAKATRNAILICRLNLAAVQAQLGQFAEASARLDEAGLPEAREVLSMRATIALRAGRIDESSDLAGRSLQARLALQQLLDHADGFSLEPPPEPAGASSPGPRVHADLSAVDRAVPSTGLLAAEDRARRAEAGQRHADALAEWGRVALLAEHAAAADRLIAALAGQQRAARAQGQADLAIHYGKRAVEEIRRQRSGLAGLDRNARRAFAQASRRVFEALADDLLEAARWPEAERALLLLRQDDVAELVPPQAALPPTSAEAALRRYEAGLQGRLSDIDRRRAAGAAAPASGMRIYEGLVEGFASDPAQVEQTVDAYGQGLWPRPGTVLPDERIPDVIVLEILREFAALRDCPGLPPEPHVQAARENARRLLERARSEGKDAARPAWLAARPPEAAPPPLQVRLRCLVQEQSLVEQQAAHPPLASLALLAQRPVAFPPDAQGVVDAGRAALARGADGSVALHYLVLEGRLRILLVSPEGWVLRDVDLPRAQLEQRVAALEWATGQPGRDAVAPARDLYRTLIGPIEPDLRRVGAQILLITADGPLRTVPFAALHDGRAWLVERYAIARGAALSDGRPSPKADRLRMAVFGASAGAAGFEALPAVAEELAGILRSGSGRAWQDAAFTAGTLHDALLAGYPVVHIASHFALREDDVGASFLLLGDGTRLTLRELGSEAYPVRGVDLVTLSSCRTARDTRDAWGQAFEGLAATLQQRGAATVLSTLWPVADASTAQLMADFYRQRAAAGKAAALRRAQLALLRAEGGESGAPTRGASRIDPAAPTDPARPWAHPYYWAPFVLAGQWR